MEEQNTKRPLIMSYRTKDSVFAFEDPGLGAFPLNVENVTTKPKLGIMIIDRTIAMPNPIPNLYFCNGEVQAIEKYYVYRNKLDEFEYTLRVIIGTPYMIHTLIDPANAFTKLYNSIFTKNMLVRSLITDREVKDANYYNARNVNVRINGWNKKMLKLIDEKKDNYDEHQFDGLFLYAEGFPTGYTPCYVFPIP